MAYIKMSSFVGKGLLRGDEYIIGLDGRNIRIPLTSLLNFFGISGTQFGGAITPASSPPANDRNYFWIAVQPGVYSAFGGVVVEPNSIAVISRIGGVFSISQTELNLAGYAKTNEVVLLTQIRSLNSDEFPRPIAYTNLFNKQTITTDYILDPLTGAIEPGVGAVSDFIYVGSGTNVWVLRYWTGAPQTYAWYDENKNFLVHSGSGSNSIPSAPGGQLPLRPAAGRYIRMNVSNAPENTEPYTNALMVYTGSSMTDYKPYYIFPDISYSYDEMSRQDSYSKVLSAIYRDSALNKFTEVADGMAGQWQIREERGATATKVDDYIRIDIDNTAIPAPNNTNAGLLMPNFFRQEEIGMKVYYRFEARLVSGYNTYSIYSNSGGSRTDVVIEPGDFKTYEAEATVGANQYGDWRLIIGVAPAAESIIEIRNFQAYFVKPFEASASQTELNLEDYNTAAMANFRYKAAGLPGGLAVVGIQGDSWTDHVPGACFYARDLSRILRAKYGDGGGGWYDFANSQGMSSSQRMASIDPDDASDTRSGTITYRDNTNYDSLGVNFAHALFASGATLTLNVLKPHDEFMISYYAGATYGVFRYRIDGGAWNTVDASTASGHQTIIEATTDATHVLEFEVTSGNVIIFGVDMRRPDGIRVHKLGNRGLRAFDIPNFDAENWKSQLTALELDAITTILGTNDRTGDRLPSAFKADMAYFVDMCRDAIPYIDVCLISPSNNKRVEPYDMPEYAQELKAISVEKDLAFLNLIPLFGTREQLIAQNTFADDVHPTIQGGTMIAQFIAEKIFMV